MMKGSKYLLLLAAFVVGLGFAGSANAAITVNSVSVTAPDSGVVRGIDSTFVVQAKVFDITANDSLEIIMYLVSTNDSTVVADTLNQSATFGTVNQASVIRRAVTGPDNADTRHLLDSETGAQAQSVVAVQQKRSRGSASAIGDADSVAAVSASDTTTFTWYGRIDASSGTTSGVRAAAVAILGTDTSAVKVSATSGQFGIDADRPQGPESLSTAGGIGYILIDDRNPNTVNNGGGSTDVAVSGIGDSLVVRTKLGTDVATDLLQGDSTKVQLDIFGKLFTFVESNRVVDTLRTDIILEAGQFGDLNTTFQAATDTVIISVVDNAGNLSGGALASDTVKRLDGPATGVTQAISFLFDTTAPTLDAAGDTLIPASGDTISDGSGQAGSYPDINLLQYELGEALDSLYVTFSGASNLDAQIAQTASTPTTSGADLTAGTTYTIDFTNSGDAAVGATSANNVTVYAGATAGGTYTTGATTAADTLITTGVHSITFQGVDLAGNRGAAVTRTDVYVDVDDINLKRLFPTKLAFGAETEARTDTLESETAKVIFGLSEPADSVLITYLGVSGGDSGKSRTRRLSGTQLTNTASEQTLPVDSLVSGSEYVLTVLARDLAGNFTQSDPDTFLYDTSYVVPVIQQFTIAASASGLGSPQIVGTAVTLTIQADASTGGTRDALTYKTAAILKVAGGSGVTLTGTGVTDEGGGRATLDGDEWVTGSRTVTLNDTTSVDSLTITIVDSTSTGGPFSGKLDSTIVYNPGTYSQILVSAPATATQDEAFWVGLTLADSYENTRVLDDRYVSVSANKLGVMLPPGDILIEKGSGGFWAKSSWTGDDLVFDVKDLLDTQTNAPGIDGRSDSVAVAAPGAAPALDGPDELVASDYMGADGAGDQGGFVMLTWDLSTDHSTVDAYRIYREVQVDTRLATELDSVEVVDDSTGVASNVAFDGKIVMLDEPMDEMIPWAKVDAVPGETIGRAIVATLDNVSTYWGVMAERNGETAKVAFTSAEAIANPYELMTKTLAESKEAVAIDANAPVFAELLPEALSFAEEGVALRFKSVDDVLQSSPITRSLEAIAAIDNIAPEAVPFVRAIDTPNDAGSSVSLTWTKSPSDQLLPRSAGAVGPVVTDMVAGVKGYNIYRKVGANGEYGLIAKANSGDTSFADETAFNGVRYTYQVMPYDDDNETSSELERTAMAIRNNVVDKDGKAVFGLFGIDNRVGFDDFFIFADNFGLSAADENFEPAFDLAPSASPKIDFDDFFVFADNFGRNIEAAGKVVPMMAGLNADTRLYLDGGAELPLVGEEMVIDVSMADFVELKAYGFRVNYDAEKLEFVRAVADNNLLGEGDLAAPRVITKGDGEVAIAAYGDLVSEGDLGLSLVFRSTMEIESSFVEVMESEVRDGNFAVNGTALPAPLQIQTRPEAFALANNYPNPFNPATTIKYALPEASDVKLEIYNVVGQVVRTLVADHQNAGRYVVQWDATNDSGHSLSSGIYFYRLQAGGEFLEVKKMLLVK